MKKFAMVLVALSALILIVNCAKKEEVVKEVTPVVEQAAQEVVEQADAVVDSAAAAVEEVVPAAAGN
ncbi:MAG TPA: hypothetical protein PLK90_03930 [Clostridiales bacterium]|nr:hypothetical protein [Clostridiales bacterium]HQP69529.1 hypothetical protein [Clostridiales bacterium]